MTSRYKFVSGCECCTSSKIMHSSLLSWHDRFLRKLKDQICNAQNIGSGEITNCSLETYKNTVMPHVNNMFQTYYDMAMAIMCAYHNQNMHNYIGNVCCVVVYNVHKWIFQVQNHISTIQMLASPYIFMCINTLHILLFLSDSLSM